MDCPPHNGERPLTNLEADLELLKVKGLIVGVLLLAFFNDASEFCESLFISRISVLR